MFCVKSNKKTMEHLLLHCPVAMELWIHISSFGLNWMMPKTEAYVAMLAKNAKVFQKYDMEYGS